MINSATGHHIVDTTGVYYGCTDPDAYYIEGSNLVVLFLAENEDVTGVYVYDISNLIDGVTFRQVTLKYPLLPLRRLLLEGDHLTIEWEPCHTDHYFITTSKRIGDRLYLGYDAEKDFKNPRYANPVGSLIFPPAETNAEWKDRMHRTLSFCAHQIEDALSNISPLLYHRSDDAHSASITTKDRIRIANVSMHARLNIGYLWHQVIHAVTELLSTKPDKSVIEAYIKKVYENMKTPEHIKAFFHSHDTEEWRKLRHASSDDRNNHRRIHIWQDDFTAGDLLLDVNLKNTNDGVLNDLEARSDFHSCATTDYKLAAVSPNWELITERVY